MREGRCQTSTFGGLPAVPVEVEVNAGSGDTIIVIEMVQRRDSPCIRTLVAIGRFP